MESKTFVIFYNKEKKENEQQPIYKETQINQIEEKKV